ncbi:MAG: mechanosensitive ion channel [Ruminococcaceae bacterium]|nr:mechanosensitive ion channel [Oscillospiraceae bacterium]
MQEWFTNLWNTMKDTVMNNWHNVLKFVLILIVGMIAVSVLVKVIRKILNKTKLKGAGANFLTSLCKVALVVIYLIILLSALGVDTTSIIAIFTTLTLAISLAVQDTISNLASGIMIIVNKPFDEGDFVDIGGSVGTVESISISSTKLKTGDNKVVVIPNKNVTSTSVTNYSIKETRRLDLTFSVAYGSDVEKVKEIILGVIAKHDNILHDPAPMVRLTEHGASSLDFVTRVWVKQADYWPVNFDLKEEVLAAFDEAGISVPFPQLDVHMVQ